MPRNSAPTLRQIYQTWVEDQIEDFKDSVSRSDLLRLADEVIEELRVNNSGQYQLTELLLCTAVDRKIFKLLKLPGFRTWSSSRRRANRPTRSEDGVRGEAEHHALRPQEVLARREAQAVVLS
jgi:hypothetical protein